MHVHACVDAESEKPHGPRRHVGAGDRQPHGHISTRREGGGGGRVSPPSQQMSPFRIAGELGGLPWSKMWIAWNGPNRAYLPLHLCWAMGGVRGPACREEELESTEPNLEMKNGENSVCQGPVCSSAQFNPWMAIMERVPPQATLASAYRSARKACVMLWWARAGVGQRGESKMPL